MVDSIVQRRTCSAFVCLLLLALSISSEAFIPNNNRQCQRTFITIDKVGQPLFESRNPQTFLARNPPEEELNVHDTLLSYLGNLQRVRKQEDTIGGLKATKSLLLFVKTHSAQQLSYDDDVDESQYQEDFSRTIVQALRTASGLGDYRLVLNLVEASVAYANNKPLLSPRIFGEALHALARTGANVSKIKRIWAMVSSKDKPSFLTAHVTAYELNVMVKALASRGKVGACLDILNQHTSAKNEYSRPIMGSVTEQVQVEVDEYIASTIFTILTDSIDPHQSLVSPIDLTQYESISSLREDLLASQSKLVCWQWNEATKLIGCMSELILLNNHVISSLLTLNDRIQTSFHGHRNGANFARKILQHMLNNGVYPDVVTCTLIIKALGHAPSKENSWMDALDLLNRMIQEDEFPNPNVFTYSAAIATCARCNQVEMALDLLEDMAGGARSTATTAAPAFIPPLPNTWVYNAVLTAIQKSDTMSLKTKKARMQGLLNQMIENKAVKGMDCAPDSVTFNTILSIVASEDDSTDADGIVLSLFLRMEDLNVSRDFITYRCGFMGLSSTTSFQSILQMAVQDIERIKNDHLQATQHIGDDYSRSPLDKSFIFHEALASIASKGNVEAFRNTIETMECNGVEKSSKTIALYLQLIQHSSIVPLSRHLECWYGDDNGDGELSANQQESSEAKSNNFLLEKGGANMPPLQAADYMKAIELCLAVDDLEDAEQVLVLMRSHGYIPSRDCMEEFALSFAKGVMELPSSQKSVHLKDANERTAVVHDVTAKRKSRAERAFKIVVALKPLSVATLGAVIKACAFTGLWRETRTTLHLLHRQLISDGSDLEGIEMVPNIHRSILRQCAQWGNVTTALRVVDDIQQLSARLNSRESEHQQGGKAGHGSPSLQNGDDSDDASISLDTSSHRALGMRAEDWVQVIIAASKSGHFKVCISTLQFIRPYLERTSPKKAKTSQEEKLFLARYQQVGPALVSAMRCLELRSQYGWATRVMDDWIGWSGRRPPLQAILAACRILSAQGEGEEVLQLVSRVLEKPKDTIMARKGMTFEQRLYIGAISTLHYQGLYDEADELFVTALSQEHLPFGIREVGDHFLVDLHGLNVALAHSAVRVTLRQQFIHASPSTVIKDMVIVTGPGQQSSLPLKPVMRSELQRMLLEEFYPPLSTLSVPKNMSALKIFASDIAVWQANQKEQKNASMMTVASALKNFSSVSRIQKTIEMAASRRKGSVEDDS